MIALHLPAALRLPATDFHMVTATLISTVELDLWIARRAVAVVRPTDLIMPVVEQRIHLRAGVPYAIDAVVIVGGAGPGTYRVVARLPCKQDEGALVSNPCDVIIA